MKNHGLTKLTIILILMGLAGFLIMVSDSFTGVGFSIFFSFLFIIIFLLIIHHDILAGRFDIFQPLVWVGIIFFLPNFLLKSWCNAVIGTDFTRYAFLKKLSAPDFYLNRSLATGVVSFACLSAGYYLLPFKKNFGQMFGRYKRLSYHAWALKWPSFSAWFIGIGLSFYLIKTGGLGYTDIHDSTPFLHVIQLLAKFNIYGMFIFLYCLIKNKPYNDLSWYTLLCIIFLGQCLLGFLMGSRGYLFLNGVIVIAVMQYSGYITNIRKIIWPIFLSGVLLVVGMILITQFREIKLEKVGFNKPLDIKSAIDIYEEMGRRKQFDAWDDVSVFFLENIIARTASLESLASVLGRADQSKKMEIAYGIDNNIYKEFLWGLVPRFIYPEKPMISDFAVKFGIIYTDNPVTMRSWSSSTVMGDLYRNFGYVGIMVGMLFLGMFLRIFYLALIEDNRNPFLYLIYVFTVLQLNYEANYVSFFHGPIRLWIIFGVLILYINMMSKFFMPKVLSIKIIKT